MISVKLPSFYIRCYVIICVIFFLDYATCKDENDQQRNEWRGNSSELMLYNNLFKIKRKEHLAAVQKLILVDDVAKQAHFIEVMMSTIIDTITKAQLNLETNDYEIGTGFPMDSSIKDELSKILENTALFTDLIVRFPKPGHIFFKKHKRKWLSVLKEAMKICNESRVYDGDYQLILHSLQQELGIGMKDPSYHNPFLQSDTIPELTTEERQELYKAAKRKKKMKDSAAKKKGPRLSNRIEL